MSKEKKEETEVQFLPGYSQVSTYKAATFGFDGESLHFSAESATELADMAYYFFLVSPRLREFLKIELEQIEKGRK